MSSKLAELERLAALRDQGVLTDDELKAEKSKLLDEVSSSPNQDPADDLSDSIPMWAIIQPIRTEAEGKSLLVAGYAAATAASIEAVNFMSKARVTSTEDNMVIVVTLILMVCAVFFAGWLVSAKRSRGAAWCLLGLACTQLFGVLTSDGIGFGLILLAGAGVIVGIQAVRATEALRKLARGQP